MGVGQGRGANFCSDVLRIRWTGPKKINISVADLPGLFDAPGQGHTQQDLEQVKSITKAYLSRARTVIVMILDGEVDPTRNGISSLREQFDRDGERTIGVITKPDLMQEHPGRAAMYKKLLDNKWDEQPLTYGWVVVKNRDLVSQGLNSAQRDKAETEFLEQGTWKEISKEQKGVHQLRRRMARAFRELISDQLPVLAKEIHEAKEATQLQIKELPAAGGDMETKQNFLRACLEARRLTTAAVEGSYVDRLFDHPDSGTNASRLRDGIEDAVATLRERLRDEGRAFDVVGGPSDTSSSQGAVLQKEYKEILANTAQSIKKMGGRPGQFSEEMTINLFQELSSKWGDIVNEFLVDIKKKVTDFVAYALDAVLPEDVTERVEHQLFTPALKTLNDSFNSHVLQLLHKARVVTAAELNREVTSEIAAARFDVVLHAFEEITTTRSSGRSHRREGSAGDLEGLKQALPEDTLTYRMAAAEALRCAEKVYEIKKNKLLPALDFELVNDHLLQKLVDLPAWNAADQLDEILATGPAERAERERLELLHEGLTMAETRIQQFLPPSTEPNPLDGRSPLSIPDSTEDPEDSFVCVPKRKLTGDKEGAGARPGPPVKKRRLVRGPRDSYDDISE